MDVISKVELNDEQSYVSLNEVIRNRKQGIYQSKNGKYIYAVLSDVIISTAMENKDRVYFYSREKLLRDADDMVRLITDDSIKIHITIVSGSVLSV